LKRIQDTRSLQLSTKEFNIQNEKHQPTFSLVLPHSDAAHKLAFELEVVGANVGEHATQARQLGEQALHYQWTCWFPNSGDLYISLTSRVLRPKKPLDFDPIRSEVKVVQILWFTSPELNICSAITAVAAFLVSVVGILASLPAVFHLFGH
jgi:hypothetical protein